MTFRARLTLAVAVSVAVSVAGASALTYVLVRNELRGEVDEALQKSAAVARVGINEDAFTGEEFLGLPRDPLGGAPRHDPARPGLGRADPTPRVPRHAARVGTHP